MVVLFTHTTLAAFAVASTFSSRLSTLTGNAVLILPRKCGYRTDNANSSSMYSIVYPYWQEKVSSSANYVQQCYAERSITEECTLYVNKNLPANPIRNASCPFSGGICKSEDSNLLLDTGYLDSNLDFGVNAPRDQNWLYRRVMHCSPLKTEGYRKSVPKLEGGLDIPYMQYFYGGDVQGVEHPTYEYPILSKSQVYAENFMSAYPVFSLNVRFVSYRNGTIDYRTGTQVRDPIEPLRRPDGDLLEWAMNETLQLQRMAHEELGMGGWKNCDGDVPVTEGRDRLAMLDLADLGHPRLKAPPVPFEQILAGELGCGKEESAAPAAESTAGETATR